MKKLIILLMLSIFAININADISIEKQIEEENKTLPKNINNSMKLMEIFLKNKTVNYNILLNGFSIEHLKKISLIKIFKDIAIPNICLNEKTENLFQNGYKLKYNFYSKEYELYDFINIDKKVCQEL